MNTQSLLYYHHISKIPTSVFIDVLCNEDYALLGNASSEALQDNWQELYSQYEECIGGNDLLRRVEKVKEILSLETFINIAEALLYVFEIDPSNENEERLKAVYGTSEIRMVKAYIKRDTVALKSKMLDIEDRNSNEEYKPTRQTFLNTIIAFTTHWKMSFNESAESIEKYCLYVLQYIKEVEEIIQQNKKIKNG